MRLSLFVILNSLNKVISSENGFIPDLEIFNSKCLILRDSNSLTAFVLGEATNMFELFLINISSISFLWLNRKSKLFITINILFAFRLLRVIEINYLEVNIV